MGLDTAIEQNLFRNISRPSIETAKAATRKRERDINTADLNYCINLLSLASIAFREISLLWNQLLVLAR